MYTHLRKAIAKHNVHNVTITLKLFDVHNRIKFKFSALKKTLYFCEYVRKEAFWMMAVEKVNLHNHRSMDTYDACSQQIVVVNYSVLP